MLVILVAAFLVDAGVYASPAVFGIIGLAFTLTAVAALIPWDRFDRRLSIAMPLANIVGIVLLREAAPQIGAGLLLVIPIIWIARTFGREVTIAGTAGAIGFMFLMRAVRGTPVSVTDFAGFVVLPVVLVFVAAAVYITARRARAQAALLRQHAVMVQGTLGKASRQESLLNEVLNAVEFGVIAFDRSGTVTFVNRKQRQNLADFGTPPDAVVHPLIYQSDGVTPYTDEDRPLTRALSGQAFDNLIIWVGEPGERRVAHAVSSRILRNADGEYDGGVIALTDITPELEAIRARDDLIGSVTHELRSPLTSILGYLDLAREEEAMSDETRKMIEVAYSNSERLLVLVTDLLKAASDSDKQLTLSFVPSDLAAIAREAVEGHRVLADEREVELTLEGDDIAPANVDPVRMRQVLDNLITNAIKYNIEWGSVTVTVTVEDAGVSVEIRDTGQGIPEADLPRIFDRFYRTSSAKNSATVGTGLGLSITREIVHRHGGQLAVSSELGIGTTFRVTVPTENDAAEKAMPAKATPGKAAA
jgi:two-component system, OmpR family, phosphate regulon sensor histidine kinase PhoR